MGMFQFSGRWFFSVLPHWKAPWAAKSLRNIILKTGPREPYPLVLLLDCRVLLWSQSWVLPRRYSVAAWWHEDSEAHIVSRGASTPQQDLRQGMDLASAGLTVTKELSVAQAWLRLLGTLCCGEFVHLHPDHPLQASTYIHTYAFAVVKSHNKYNTWNPFSSEWDCLDLIWRKNSIQRLGEPLKIEPTSWEVFTVISLHLLVIELLAEAHDKHFICIPASNPHKTTWGLHLLPFMYSWRHWASQVQ